MAAKTTYFLTIQGGGQYRAQQGVNLQRNGFSLPLRKRGHIRRFVHDGQIPYGVATGLAHNFKFMDELLQWLEKNRNWKDGGYFAAAAPAPDPPDAQ